MDGGSLSNLLAQLGPVPEGVLANMTFQVLWGLAYLKHVKRLHRDLKPANLLINSSGEVKLTDFGVSSALTNSIAMCGTFVGTFKYMSPERITAARYSFASDIWSLGIVLMECATGEYPYPTSGSHIDMAQTVLEAPEPQLPRDGSFSPEFCDFVRQCVQKDPAQRLPADILLGSPWLKRHGAVSYEAAIANVRSWIESMLGGDGDGDADSDADSEGEDGAEGKYAEPSSVGGSEAKVSPVGPRSAGAGMDEDEDEDAEAKAV